MSLEEYKNQMKTIGYHIEARGGYLLIKVNNCPVGEITYLQAYGSKLVTDVSFSLAFVYYGSKGQQRKALALIEELLRTGAVKFKEENNHGS